MITTISCVPALFLQHHSICIGCEYILYIYNTDDDDGVKEEDAKVKKGDNDDSENNNPHYHNSIQ